MLFTNAKIFTPQGFLCGALRVEDGRFAELLPGAQPSGGTDLGGAAVIPGLVDIHTHGASGVDFSDGDAAKLREMARFLALHGVASFAPTTMSLPYPELSTALKTAAALQREAPAGCARVLGVHLEGPFLSAEKKGAQNAAYMRAPDLAEFEALQADCGGIIRLAGLSPELPGAAEFAAAASRDCTVAAAHTAADYDCAAAFFEAGARHVTHLFNAMPPLLHRAPGVIGAAAEREDVTAELICDGAHVHPGAVRAAFRLFPERICLISDAVRCCGMPEGEYTLGGQRVYLRGGTVRLADGTIAGSAATLFDCLRNAIAFGIPEEAAIRAATATPAAVLRCADCAGAIVPGRSADFLVCGPDWELRAVYLGGERIR